MKARILKESPKNLDIHPDRFEEHDVGEMKVYYARSTNQDVSFAAIMTLAGSFFDPKNKKGLAHLTEHMLFTGSDKYTESEIENLGLSCGAYFNAYTSQDAVCVFGSPLTRKLDDFIDVLTEVACNSKPNESVFDREHNVLMQERQDGDADLESVMDNHLYRNTLEDCPLSLPVIGTEESVKDLTFQDVMDYRNKYFVPERQVMVIRTAVPWDELESILEKYFHGDTVERVDFSEISNPYTLKENDSIMESSFPTLALSYVMPFPLKIPENGKANLIVNMAGKNGMNSILWEILRKEKGLVYGVSAGYRTFMHSPKSPLTVSATFSDISKLDEVKETIRESFRNPAFYTKERLEQVKLGMEASMAHQGLSAEGHSWHFLHNLYIGETTDFKELFRKISSVSLSDIREALEELELWKGRFFVIKPGK